MSRFFCLLIAFVIVASPVIAGSVQVSPPTDNVASHTRVLHSKVLDQARNFTVHLPFGYEQQPDRRYPVLVVLDGDAYTGLVAETAHLFWINGEAPPLIVVGISNIDRTYDFTPFPLDAETVSGGGTNFLRFLDEELLAFMDQEYRTNGYRVIFGHSFGGLIGVYALICQPDIFNACIAASPALYSDRGRTLRTIEKTLADQTPDGPKFLYLSMADELGYAESLDFLKEKLEPNDDQWLRWQERRHPGETHGSVVLRVIPDGLRGLFENWQLPPGAMAAGWEPVRDHYERLSKQMGYYVMVPEGRLNLLGYNALGNGDTAEAIRLFRLNTRFYPTSANTWDSLAEGLMKNGDLAAATTNYRKSLQLNPENENATRMLMILGKKKKD